MVVRWSDGYHKENVIVYGGVYKNVRQGLMKFTDQLVVYAIAHERISY